MALTGIAFARAKRRKQIFVATSSVGPGSTNMITAAAVAMSNRLPILFLPGDTYANRMPDPALQQVEHFNNPGITQNDSFKPVTRYFDKITRPEQILQTLPQAIQIMLQVGLQAVPVVLPVGQAQVGGAFSQRKAVECLCAVRPQELLYGHLVGTLVRRNTQTMTPVSRTMKIKTIRRVGW